ncbi:MAG: hypothetical protein IPI42_11215 [Saprospiraceae bacterium]|nr:hypothetical protein [Candidatus Parvibacillus calidus]
MYFKSVVDQSGWTLAGYYRLESYRNANDRVCHRTLLNIGLRTSLPIRPTGLWGQHI